MAEKRMFAKAIVDSDIFLEMPVSARLLYYDLNMRADDDGFVNSPKKIMRITGATNDDMNVLIARKYVIPFDSGIVVIRHWRINNYLRSDRYHETAFKNEKAQLVLEDGVYYGKSEDKQLTSGIPSGIPVGDADKNSIDKNSIDKNSKKTSTTSEKKKLHFGEYNHVQLTQEEYDKLKKEFGEKAILAGIKKVDEYCEESGKKYKNYSLPIKRWGLEGFKPLPQPEKIEEEDDKPSEEWQKMWEDD